MSISHDNIIILWNVNNWEILIKSNEANIFVLLFLACFLKNLNNIYLLSSNVNGRDFGSINVFDINGKKCQQLIILAMIRILLIFFDKILSEIYIIAGNFGFIRDMIFFTINYIIFIVMI